MIKTDKGSTKKRTSATFMHLQTYSTCLECKKVRQEGIIENKVDCTARELLDFRKIKNLRNTFYPVGVEDPGHCRTPCANHDYLLDITLEWRKNTSSVHRASPDIPQIIHDLISKVRGSKLHRIGHIASHKTVRSCKQSRVSHRKQSTPRAEKRSQIVKTPLNPDSEPRKCS